jgi:SAM-dependent methyltransferase
VSSEQRDYWTEGAAGWVENERIFDAVFAPITAAILEAAAIESGNRLLDIGCGSGTLLAAGRAAGASVAGIDIASGMVEAAQRRVPNAAVVVGDAQNLDLLGQLPGPPFDRLVSRFGVMFFADPAAAFANIRGASAPDARLAFVCWRSRAENPIFTCGTSVFEERLDSQAAASAGTPGATAFADPDHVISLLTAAGWDSVTVAPLDTECDFGIDGSDGVEERLAVILSTGVGRQASVELAPVLGPDAWAALLDDVRADLRRHLVAGAVRFPAATWLVSARNVLH